MGGGGGGLKSPKLFRAKIVETERGVSLEFGKFVALISFSGLLLQVQGNLPTGERDGTACAVVNQL